MEISYEKLGQRGIVFRIMEIKVVTKFHGYTESIANKVIPKSV